MSIINNKIKTNKIPIKPIKKRQSIQLIHIIKIIGFSDIISEYNNNNNINKLFTIVRMIWSSPNLHKQVLKKITLSKDSIEFKIINGINSNYLLDLNSILFIFIDCNISDDDIKYLTDNFKQLKDIKMLNLSNNNITNKGLIYLSDNLIKLPLLENLDLSHNCFTDPFESKIINRSKSLYEIIPLFEKWERLLTDLKVYIELPTTIILYKKMKIDDEKSGIIFDKQKELLNLLTSSIKDVRDELNISECSENNKNLSNLVVSTNFIINLYSKTSKSCIFNLY